MGSSNSRRAVVQFQDTNKSYSRENLHDEEEKIKILSKYKLIWLDNNINSIENIQKEIYLKYLIEDLFVFQNILNAQEKLKEFKYEKIFLIINTDNYQFYEFILNIHRINQIAAIYLYSKYFQYYRQLLRPIEKVRYISNNFDMILKKLEKDLISYENLESIKFLSNIFYPSDRLLRNQYYFVENLSNLCNTQINNDRKKILFQTYKDYYKSHQNLINKFEENFQISTSIYWYTSQRLIYNLFNYICQINDLNSLWKYEYLIKCLFIQLKSEHELFRKNLNHKSIIYVYKAQLMTILEFKRLKMQIGKNILIHNFLLANYDKDNIIYYINQCQPSSNEICFIFKILINTQFKNTQPYTTIHIKNQKQLLIMLLALFYVQDVINNPHDNIPIVILQLIDNQQQFIKHFTRPRYEYLS